MRKILLFVALGLMLAGCAGLGGSLTPGGSNAEAVVRQWVEGFNKADMATVTGMLTPDAKILPFNATRYATGAEVLRDLFVTDFAYGVQIRIENLRASGNTVTSDVTLWSPKRGAMPDTPAQYTWLVSGDKIAEIQIRSRQ